MSTTITEVGRTNSTSYADVVGLQIGLDRLPGESTADYLDRLAVAASSQPSGVYESLVNQIGLTLGLSTEVGFTIAGPQDTVIQCDLSGLSLVSGVRSMKIDIVTLDEDEVWNWNSLSKIVASINQSGVWTAQLKTTDKPAVFLCKQTNAGVGMPYECVVSGIGLIGLTEPSLPVVAATPSGGLAYQVREFLQAFIERDRAYWSK